MGGGFLADYKQMYISLFHAVTDALEQLQTGNLIDAEYALKKAQVKCEELFMETEPDIEVANTKKIINIHNKEGRG